MNSVPYFLGVRVLLESGDRAKQGSKQQAGEEIPTINTRNPLESFLLTWGWNKKYIFTFFSDFII